MKRWNWAALAAVILAVGGFGSWRWWNHSHNGQPRYRTVRIERGDLVQTIHATGIVQPIRSVLVGTQVNGPVQKLFADFNSRVKAGDVVAQIDPAVYEARLAQDDANLAQATASVDEARARLTQAEKELVRARELAGRDLLSQSELDAAQASRDTLAAQLKVAEAQVDQARAARRLSKTNLDYTTIRSPVDGVVVSRNVSEGQTVVASLSAQTIFTVAADLQHMQVEASVPEADIGKVREGQTVTFTVDAYEQSFTGQVAQVRLSAASVQNVVTYPVIILADNPDGRLFPGMTANIACEVARAAGVLKVPNAALRFRPAPPSPSAKPDNDPKGGADKGGPRGPTLWMQKYAGAEPEAARIRVGISDGSGTEILDAAGLAEGQEVITGLESGAANPAAAKPVNPFTPQMPGARSAPKPR